MSDYTHLQPSHSTECSLSRRRFLRTVNGSFAGLALNALVHELAGANTSTNPSKAPHFKPRAKSVIYLSMPGGPSQVDTFDCKPELNKYDGKSAEMVGGGTPSRLNSKGNLWASPWRFSRHGQSGLPISELFPHVAKHADDLCLLNGMHTDVSGHALASQMQFTGSFQFVRPSLGSWILYGLGSEATEVPGFVSLRKREFGPAFLPPTLQATQIDVKSGVRNIRNPSMSSEQQLKKLDFVRRFDQKSAQHHPELSSAVESLRSDFEMAFRMQASVPGMLDLKNESPDLLEEYGIGAKQTNNFGTQCLLARRLVEKGVRFVQVEGGSWDHHHTLQENLAGGCMQVDQPIAALLTDLKQRSLLDETLVIWAGEFGRTPFSQVWKGSRTKGRDHNAIGYTIWLAGGGVKGGLRYGSTDELGSKAIDGRVHIHDLHATVLHLLGLNHTRLTFRYGGRDFRLTDVHGEVAHDILA